MKKLTIILVALSALLGCAKESLLQLNSEVVSMYSLEEHTITSNGTNVTFSSENPYIASVNETTGLVTAMHIGETYIIVNADQGSKKVKVTVKAQYHVIKDPYLKWGCSKEEVIRNVGNPTQNNEDNLIYQESLSGHVITGYQFQNGGLYMAMCAIASGYETYAVKHIAERYQYWGYSSDKYIFTDSLSSEEYTTLVIITQTSGVWTIMYVKK